MSDKLFLKNITSKDNSVFSKTIKILAESNNIANFEILSNNSDFIFPFLKEKIIKNFVKLINKENLKIIFNFTKIYSSDFEDLIVQSWLKFASEDLTDEILELFENGTNEQKAYCAKYFYHIQDSLAIEFLNQNSLSEFLPLKINCAKALSKFDNTEVLNSMKEKILNSSDDFEKFSAFEFISAYGGSENINFIIQNSSDSAFENNIITNLLDYNDLDYLKNILNNRNLAKIFSALIEQYPEDISLNTISYYQVYDFIEFLYNNKNQYIENILALAKIKFAEFQNNDIYSFDLDKNTKEELKRISNKLNSLELNLFQEQELELFDDKNRFETSLDVIKEYKLIDYSKNIAKLINEEKIPDTLLAKSAQTLKKLNGIHLIDKEIIEKLENANIKALIKSYFTTA